MTLDRRLGAVQWEAAYSRGFQGGYWWVKTIADSFTERTLDWLHWRQLVGYSAGV